jgi:hypothetical protein
METRSQPFEFDGQTVHPIYRRQIVPGTTLDVEFLAARATPAQGLEVTVKDALLAWDEHEVEGRAIRLWADKQRRATLRYVNPRKSTEISIWNIWLEERRGAHTYEADSYEIVQAWWAWSGMLIEETAQGVVLRCSGSYDGPDFDDLVARVTFNDAS